MGIRGELFSQKVILPNRTYFFNVKENRLGDLYLNIVESKNKDSGGFDRQSVILFADDLQEFLKGFEESLKVMEKAMRGKKRGSGEREERSVRGENSSSERKPRSPRGEHGSEREERPKKFQRGERSERKPRSEYSNDRKPRGEYSGERKGRSSERKPRSDSGERVTRSERSFGSERKPRGAGSGAPRGASSGAPRGTSSGAPRGTSSGAPRGAGRSERGPRGGERKPGGKRVVVKRDRNRD